MSVKSVNLQPMSSPSADTGSGPLVAQPDAVATFRARMAAGTPKKPPEWTPLATDEQILTLPPADVERLKIKWAGDEDTFRREAYEFYEFFKASQELTAQQLALSEYKRRQEEKAEARR
ncbi:hypothetical protein [Caenimonas koreensis]